MKNVMAIFVFLLAATAFSQQVDVKGQVLDAEFNNEPLAFAYVKVQGFDLEAVSDENGQYALALTPGSYTLEVEFIGYETQVINDVNVGRDGLNLDPVALGARRMQRDNSVALYEDEIASSKE